MDTSEEVLTLRRNAKAEGGYWSSVELGDFEAAVVRAPSSAASSLDTLPVEVRLMVFRHVLYFEHSLVTLDGRRSKSTAHPQQRPVDLSLFQVNRQIGREARDVFFEIKVIRIDQARDRQFCLDDLRHPELTGELALGHSGHQLEKDNYSALKTFITQPKLRSLMIAYDKLARPWRGLAQCLETTLIPRIDIECMDFGLFELRTHIKTRAKIYLQNYALTSLLPKAMAMAREESLEELLRRAHAILDMQPRSVERRTLSLAHGLSCFEALRLLEANPGTDKFCDKEKQIVQCYVRLHKNKPLWWMHDSILPKGVGFMSLQSHEHDSLMLEWASEVLGLYSAR